MPRVFGPLLILVALMALHFARQALHGRYSAPAAPANPSRIVSLAPSVTETLYALGLGPQVVGVTQFCAWPPDVASKPRVAGFSDIYLEAVLRAQPDLAVLPVDKTAGKALLEGLGIPVLTLDTRSLPGLLRAMEHLGAATGRQAQAADIISSFQRELRAAEERARGKARPRVLFSVMHSEQGLGYIAQINAVGRDGFYNELIQAAGGENVYDGNLAFPRLSREAVIFLNPDVIVDVIPAGENLEAVRRDWQSLTNVKAIRNHRLVLLTDAADTVPGPRSARTLSKLSRAFHPDTALTRPERN